MAPQRPIRSTAKENLQEPALTTKDNPQEPILTTEDSSQEPIPAKEHTQSPTPAPKANPQEPPIEDIKKPQSSHGLNFDPSLTPHERVTLFLTRYRDEITYKGFDRRLIQRNLELISAGPKETAFELTVTERFTDIVGKLHTGAASLILDVCTTTALIPCAEEGFWQSLGLTRSLNVTYIRPALEGARLVIESEVVSAEEKQATIRGIMRDQASGDVICTVEHLKIDVGLL